MKKFTVRVTRVYEDEYLDIEVEAEDWDEARENAVAEAAGMPDAFGPRPLPDYVVLPIDCEEPEDEE